MTGDLTPVEEPIVATETRAVRRTGSEVRLLTPNEMKLQSQLRWLVRGMLPHGSIGMLVGQRGTYKSFLALDLALSVSAGRPWLGADVEQGAVVYVSTEGRSGLGKRIDAWEQSRGCHASTSCRFWPGTVQFHLPESVDTFIDLVKRDMADPPVLVVVDTLARCFVGGDENEAGQIGEFVAGIDQLSLAFGCAVLVVHHSGYGNAKRARGSSALEAAMDTVWHVARVEKSQSVTFACTKQKDDDQFEPRMLTPREVRLGADKTSLVFVTEADELDELDHVILNRLDAYGPMDIKALRCRMTNQSKDMKPIAEKRLRDRLNKKLILQGYVTATPQGQAGKIIYAVTAKAWERSAA